MKALVCISNYGNKQIDYLHQLLAALDAAKQFQIEIVLHTTEQVDLRHYSFKWRQSIYDPAIREDLAFEHRKVMVERQNDYDLFIYTENDMLITGSHLSAFCDATAALPHPYVVGFLRYERNRRRLDDTEWYLPDVHPSTPYFKGQFKINGKICLVLANKHQGSFFLTRSQLKHVIESREFTRAFPPFVRSLEVAASLVYFKCGLEKVLPLEYLDRLMIHHLSDKYVNCDEAPWNITPPLTLTALKAECAGSPVQEI